MAWTLEEARGWVYLVLDAVLVLTGVVILLVEVWRPGPGEGWVAIIAAGLMASPFFTPKARRDDSGTRPDPEGGTPP